MVPSKSNVDTLNQNLKKKKKTKQILLQKCCNAKLVAPEVRNFFFLLKFNGKIVRWQSGYRSGVPVQPPGKNSESVRIIKRICIFFRLHTAITNKLLRPYRCSWVVRSKTVAIYDGLGERVREIREARTRRREWGNSWDCVLLRTGIGYVSVFRAKAGTPFFVDVISDIYLPKRVGTLLTLISSRIQLVPDLFAIDRVRSKRSKFGQLLPRIKPVRNIMKICIIHNFAVSLENWPVRHWKRHVISDYCRNYALPWLSSIAFVFIVQFRLMEKQSFRAERVLCLARSVVCNRLRCE